VYIPRTFKGTIRAKTQDGTIAYSPRVSQNIVTIYEKGSESRHCIGLATSGGFDRDEDIEDMGSMARDRSKVKHDHMRLDAKSRDGDSLGTVYVAFEDE
jgi:hypothetical protein